MNKHGYLVFFPSHRKDLKRRSPKFWDPTLLRGTLKDAPLRDLFLLDPSGGLGDPLSKSHEL